jgi:hypothetical protein
MLKWKNEETDIGIEPKKLTHSPWLIEDLSLSRAKGLWPKLKQEKFLTVENFWQLVEQSNITANQDCEILRYPFSFDVRCSMFDVGRSSF